MAERILLSNCNLYYNDAIHYGVHLLIDDQRIVNVIQDTDDLPVDAYKVDLTGKFVYPGFVDTHTHSFEGGLYTGGLNLSQCSSIADVLDAIQTHIRLVDPDTTLFCWAFDENKIREKRFPSAAELRGLSDKLEIIIRRIDGHSCVINHILATKLGRNPELIHRGGENDHIVHHLHHNLDEASIINAYDVASQQALKGGFTSIHTMVGDADNSITHYRLLDRVKHQFPVRYLLYPQSFNLEQALDAGASRIGGCILADGSFGSYTAAIGEKYLGREGNGVLYHDSDFWMDFISQAHKHNLQVAIHCIGDRAIKQINDVYLHLNRTDPKDLRHELIHMELTPDFLIDEIAASGANAVVQPSFDLYWGGEGQYYEQVLGKERTLQMNRFNTLVHKGVNVCFGSDWYITELDALQGIFAAVNHHNPKERITIDEAIRAYTINAARLSHDEHEYGLIAPGYYADLCVYDSPLDDLVDAQNITPRLISVYSHGKLVHHNE